MKLNLKSAIHWFHADFKAADNDTSDDRLEYARCFSLIFIHLGCLGLFWVGWSWTAVSIALFLYFTRMFAITAFLHRFNWLNDEDIGNIDKKWNWLAMEYEEKDDVNLIHYTIGTPCFKEYSNKSFSSYWKVSFFNLLDGYYKKEILK